MFRLGWQLRVIEKQLGPLVLVLALFVGTASANTVTGKVVGVSDGDTIMVLDADRQQHKIRVAGIDAPEKGQAFGQRAKASLSRLVFGKEVEVRWNKQDRYRRIVGKVLVAAPDCVSLGCAKTLDAGLDQVAAGHAWWYRKYARDQSHEDAGRYEEAEDAARARKGGLWVDPHPTAPWDWREERRRN